MSTNSDTAFQFGNVVFEVSCKPPREAYEGAVAVYAPASVSAYSGFPDEAEILFPPNVQFKVMEVKTKNVPCPVFICETIAFDSDEGIQEFQTFKKAFDEAIKKGEL